MLRLRALRPTNDKIVKIQLHPTHPWLVSADASDHVSVWNWEHRQVIYELKAGGVDQRRLVGAKLEKLAEGEFEPKVKRAEAIRGGSVKQVSFYDDDVHYWELWRNYSAAAEAPAAVDNVAKAFSSPPPSTKGRHFLVICCENKAIFLDLVTMRGRDVAKQELDNKPLLCMEFLCKSAASDGPLVAFGGSDGVIRVLSMLTWRLYRRYTGGHKGSVACLMTFMAATGEALLVSGGSDGLLVVWQATHGQDSKELVPKLSLKAHDGGVTAIEIARVSGAPPYLITIGADKTLAIWDTVSFKELRRMKPVSKMACNSVASWCHPRAPNLDILTCVKDSHIWAIEHPTYSSLSRPLCELTSLVPPQLLASRKKLKVYSMVAHSLQPHLVATGTNIGILICEFDAKALPPVAPLPAKPGSRENAALYLVDKELKLLQFQPSNTQNPSQGSHMNDAGRVSSDKPEQLQVTQTKKHISTTIPQDSYSVLSVSSSGKYLAIVWPDIPYFSVYKVSDWKIVDSGTARILVWDTCRDRFALMESALPPKMPVLPRGSSSKKVKEAAAAYAAQAAAAASMASSASVQARILLEDGTSNILMRSVGKRGEPISGLHGGALLGISYRTSRRIGSFSSAAGFSGSSPLLADDVYPPHPRKSPEAEPMSFQLYSWETFEPIGSLLPQPEWTAWDQTVEYCAFAYQNYIIISSLRPQFRYLGDVAIPFATGALWHRRQLFVTTPTTIECVYVDAGVSRIDIETKRKKEEIRIQEAQSRAFAEHGELALISVDSLQSASEERIALRPPLLQVVRLASFQHAPSIPPFLTLPRQPKVESDDSSTPKEMEERKVNEVAVGGGGVAVAVTRFPAEQKRPVGPLVIVGVRDGALWLIDRYMRAHAISLSHPGIRCRCLAAYGDAVSAVKWASRLGREHHDDLAQFMLGMGYATEALHLPGISKRLEFNLAMKSNDLKRALQCILTMSNSRNMGQEALGLDLNDIMNLSSKKENVVDAVQGIVKFAKEFLDLIDAADATGQTEIAREALKRLAAAGCVKGALKKHELRGLALRLAEHGELTRLGNLANNLVSIGLGREASFAAALLGDNVLMEKALQETGMLAEAVLHAHAHGRPQIRGLVQTWNTTLQKEMEHVPSAKIDATAALLASFDASKLTSLQDSARKLPIEILPPGMASLYGPNPGFGSKKPGAAIKNSLQHPGKPLMLEAAPQTTSTLSDDAAAALPLTESDGATSTEPRAEPSTESRAEPATDSGDQLNSAGEAAGGEDSSIPDEPTAPNLESKAAPPQPELEGPESEPTALESESNIVESVEENQEQASPAPSNAETTETKETASAASTQQEGNNKAAEVAHGEFPMIDFT
ncbi:uncharacterized protein LOC127262598 [Andrographis paniculata]|uniref:uncharacterized protein LOC127262598 n=1 Tax=Andrographis paniculata TaxID=175694 RepID=UPI0021E90386|nr:uncharacterized protein LOC127262598 [Andrographis paniculata]